MMYIGLAWRTAGVIDRVGKPSQPEQTEKGTLISTIGNDDHDL